MKIYFTKNAAYKEITEKFLRELFENVEFDENTPDFVFCGPTQTTELFKYSCARIMTTGENIIPDFNCVDYAVGFHYLEFEDRYLRMPMYCFLDWEYPSAMTKHLNVDEEVVRQKKFCNFVYSNGKDAMPEREQFFYNLSQYRKVDSGGKYLNNIGGYVSDKIEFQKKYKFTIAFENARANGYTTEKIFDAFAAGTIPIYYGNPRIGEEFNEKAFINCHNYKSLEAVIEAVKELDQDDQKYLRMLREPVFNDMEAQKDPLSLYRDFLYHICKQSPEAAIRRCNDCWGERLQKEEQEYCKYMDLVNRQDISGKLLRFARKHLWSK